MSKQGESTDVVTITLTPAECRELHRLGKCFLDKQEASQELLSKLNEAEALSMWLRDQVRVELDAAEQALLRDLQDRAMRPAPITFSRESVEIVPLQTA